MHFSVLVIGEDVESILDPYDENAEGEPEVVATYNEIIEQAAEDVMQKLNDYNNFITNRESLSKEKDFERTEERIMRDYAKAMARRDLDQEQLFLNFKEDKNDEGYDFDDEGNMIEYAGNPYGRWDWWTIGGRWNNILLRKDGMKTNSCTIGELNLENLTGLSSREIKAEEKFWRACIEEDKTVELTEEEATQFSERLAFCPRDKFLKKYKDIKTFIKEQSSVNYIHALVGYDHGWEEGEGFTDGAVDSWKELLISTLKEYDEDTVVTIVDCHC